jgi:hypothetical protein
MKKNYSTFFCSIVQKYVLFYFHSHCSRVMVYVSTDLIKYKTIKLVSITDYHTKIVSNLD